MQPRTGRPTTASVGSRLKTATRVGAAVAVALVTLVACTSGHAITTVAEPGTSTSATPGAEAPIRTDDTLMIGTPSGIAVIDPSTAAVRSSQPIAVSSGDGSRWLTSTPGDATTRVGVFDPATGSEQASVAVDGRWTARVASPNGRAVALTTEAAAPMPPYLAPARAATTMMIVRPDEPEGRPQLLTLDGNFEPEAFSVDHTSLFILQFTPALAPERYRVRRLDLASGTVHDVLDRTKAPQGDMPGQARTQVRAPDGSALYTLYTVDAGHGHHDGPHAFVHVLDLENQFAHCIDLPTPFGSARQEVAALAITADGSRLFAADRAAGAIATMDLDQLTVTATAPLDARPDATTVTAVVGTDDQLLVTTDAELTTIDIRDLRQTATRRITSAASAIYQSPVSRRIYVASEGMIAVFERDTRWLRTIDVSSVGRVISIGPGAGPLPAQREAYQCAC